MIYLSDVGKYAFAPYKFIKETYLLRDMDWKDCYFLVEFYFLVGFLEKKLPLKIVQFIFAIVKKKQENLHALYIANRALGYKGIPSVMAYQTIPSVMTYQRHFEYSVPWDRHPDPDPEAAAEAAAKAEARAEAKKNKKLWVKKKKGKLLEYKNRGLKR
jgi:hypothetical protein